ncbi:MAG: hypothetical protein ACT4N3_06840 [Sphingosinicella sp.]
MAAFLIVWWRGARGIDAGAAMPAALLALGLQSLHVAEEFSTGFQHRMPALWGLPAWSDGFFVSVNLAAIALWCAALARLAKGRAGLPALTLLWFLGLASIGNSIWHPLLALATSGYFPGLATALAMPITGALLLRALMRPPAPGR